MVYIECSGGVESRFGLSAASAVMDRRNIHGGALSSNSSDYTDIHPSLNPFLLRACLDCSMIRRREVEEARYLGAR